MPADRPLHVHGDGCRPRGIHRSPGPFARKFCPFCACDHLWHKEDSKFWRRKWRPGRASSKRADSKTASAAAQASGRTSVLAEREIARRFDDRSPSENTSRELVLRAQSVAEVWAAEIIAAAERSPLRYPKGTRAPSIKRMRRLHAQRCRRAGSAHTISPYVAAEAFACGYSRSTIGADARSVRCAHPLVQDALCPSSRSRLPCLRLVLAVPRTLHRRHPEDRRSPGASPIHRSVRPRPSSVGAQLARQPTPSSMARAEQKRVSNYQAARLTRAQALDNQNNPACKKAVRKLKALVGM